MNEFDAHVETVSGDIPRLKPKLTEYSEYLLYIGLGMAAMLLIVLVCFVLGLFYGFCGKRPGGGGGHYDSGGDDCCNTGTGANWLLAAVYLTFMFSFVLLVVATAMFLVGSTTDKVCFSIYGVKPHWNLIFVHQCL